MLQRKPAHSLLVAQMTPAQDKQDHKPLSGEKKKKSNQLHVSDNLYLSLCK